jgi:hypothetical protein
VLEASGGARLSPEACLRRLVLDEARVEDFDGDGAVDEEVRGAVDRAHPALAQTVI